MSIAQPPVPDPAAPHQRPTAPPAALDGLGAAVSCACAAHCVLLPGAVALLPAFGLAWLLDERVEWGLLAVTLVIGGASLLPAAWRGRGTRGAFAPVLLFVAGAALLTAARRGADETAVAAGAREERETPLVLGGAALVAGAHLTNRRRAGRCPPGRTPGTPPAASPACLTTAGRWKGRPRQRCPEGR